MDDLLLGVIGLGATWDRFRVAVPGVEGIAITAIHDPVAQRARAQALQLDCAAVEGFHALLQRVDVQAALILGRTWYGPQPVLAACKGSIPTLVTEPPTVSDLTRPTARDVFTSCGNLVFVEFVHRRCPATCKVIEILRETDHGPLSLTVNLAPFERAEHDNICGHTQGTVWIHAVDWCNAVVNAFPHGVEVAACNSGKPQTVVVRYPSGSVARICRHITITPPETQGGHASVLACVEFQQGAIYVLLPNRIVVQRGATVETVAIDTEEPPEVTVLRQFKTAVHGGPTDLTPLPEVLGIVDLLRSAHDQWD